MKRQVFYSFHYERDVWRVQMVRNMGVVDGTEELSANQWEEIKRKGDDNIKRWINANMQLRSCLVVLVGTQTADREWVQYEIKHAWDSGKGVVGIYIHNLKDESGNTATKGDNPFDTFTVGDKNLSDIVKCYNPSIYNTYSDIKNNISDWVEEAIKIRNEYGKKK